MSEQIDDDTLEPLRRADPVADDEVPAESLDRIRARVRAATVTDPGSRSMLVGRTGLAIGGVGAAVLVLTLISFLAQTSSMPSTFASPSSGPILAACVDPYSLESLARRDFAFDGTVAAIDGDEVTFRVDEAFRDIAASEVTLTAMGMSSTVISSASGPQLVVGGRYLVAGDDHFVWPCGFTQDYDAAAAASWRQALDR